MKMQSYTDVTSFLIITYCHSYFYKAGAAIGKDKNSTRPFTAVTFRKIDGQGKYLSH